MKLPAIQFSAQSDIQIVPLADGPCVYVVDNVLESPEQVLEFARSQRPHFLEAQGNPFPGEQMGMPDEFSQRFDEYFRRHLRGLLGGRRSLQMYSRLSRVTYPAHSLDARQRVCHRDSAGLDPRHMIAASVIYLFDDVDLGGTVFFRPLRDALETATLVHDAGTLDSSSFNEKHNWPAKYMTESNSFFEVSGRVPPKWNRAIFYDGGIFHTSDIAHPEKLQGADEFGRLTINGFFTCTRRAT